jgi:hypothetical protein
MGKSKLFSAFFVTVTVFGFTLLCLQSLLCKLFSAACFDSPIIFAYPEIAYTALGLIVFSIIANMPFFIACFMWRTSLIAHKKMLLLIAAISPILLMLLLYVLSTHSMPQIEGDEWLYMLIVPCAGLLGGYAMFWAHSKFARIPAKKQGLSQL